MNPGLETKKLSLEQEELWRRAEERNDFIKCWHHCPKRKQTHEKGVRGGGGGGEEGEGVYREMEEGSQGMWKRGMERMTVKFPVDRQADRLKK